MHVLLIVFGALLLLFGGGCTLIFLASLADGPDALFSEHGLLLGVWVPFGLLPLVGGWFLLRAGLRIDRVKRQVKPNPETKP